MFASGLSLNKLETAAFVHRRHLGMIYYQALTETAFYCNI